MYKENTWYNLPSEHKLLIWIHGEKKRKKSQEEDAIRELGKGTDECIKRIEEIRADCRQRIKQIKALNRQ